ncbi:MAG: hypothetical protein FWF45_00695 [Coriobacteriia bacterium]|nr:hypothetical protein [Coriobacteriia bacterium]
MSGLASTGLDRQQLLISTVFNQRDYWQTETWMTRDRFETRDDKSVWCTYKSLRSIYHLKPSELTVYAVIYGYSRPDLTEGTTSGSYTGSTSRLTKFGISKGAASEAVTRLKTVGLIDYERIPQTRQNPDGGTNYWVLVDPINALFNYVPECVEAVTDLEIGTTDYPDTNKCLEGGVQILNTPADLPVSEGGVQILNTGCSDPEPLTNKEYLYGKEHFTSSTQEGALVRPSEKSKRAVSQQNEKRYTNDFVAMIRPAVVDDEQGKEVVRLLRKYITSNDLTSNLPDTDAKLGWIISYISHLARRLGWQILPEKLTTYLDVCPAKTLGGFVKHFISNDYGEFMCQLIWKD